MGVKLRVLHGKLKSKRGESLGAEVDIHRARFVIGSSHDCQMRCPSGSISARHCEISLVDQQIWLRDLGSETGTFVNGQQITQARQLRHGDHLRVGRLEFEVCVDSPPARKADPVGELVSEMLVEADEEERAIRLADPELRHFRRSDAVAPAAEGGTPEEEDKLGALRKKLPAKKPPGKLPPPPSVMGKTSTDAAEKTLKKILEPPKRRGRS